MSISWIADEQKDITGERITALMFRHRYTVSSLAAAIGKGRAAISTKVHGHTRWYGDELVAIAAVLNTTVGYLLGETDDDRRPAHMSRYKDAPTASAVEASRDLVAANAFHSVPPEGFEPPTFGSGEQTIGFISALMVLIL